MMLCCVVLDISLYSFLFLEIITWRMSIGRNGVFESQFV